VTITPGRGVTIVPTRGSLLVHGSYPHVASRCKHPEQPTLDARYPGKLTVSRAKDGTLDLSLTLPFERYLEGLAEVPPTWPMAALEAQAIAARSYALATTGWTGAQGAPLPTPICASTDCQVYRGIPVPAEPAIRRWNEAVRRTAGQVLLYQGRPADTVYFSTSNGHTYGNDQVFGSAPLPYLRPVPEHDDHASPLSHWRVAFGFTDLTRFLVAAGAWPDGPRITAAQVHDGDVTLRGGGTARTISLGTLQADVNGWAPCLAPGRYPPASLRGTTRLPVTIPSSTWASMSVDGRTLVVSGRGWGHGVGMVQWGAYGKARRGLSAAQILAAYYGGLRPAHYPEPGTIHVRLVQGLTSLTVVAAAPARVDGQTVPAGRRVVIRGGDALHVSVVG
jgi:stage II sporulation protein D